MLSLMSYVPLLMYPYYGLIQSLMQMEQIGQNEKLRANIYSPNFMNIEDELTNSLINSNTIK